MRLRYIRDKEDKIIGAIVRRKFIAILIALFLISCGILYSVIYAPYAGAKMETALEQRELPLYEIWINRIEDDTNVRRMTVSAYTSEKRQTDNSPEIGATGENIYKLLQTGIRTCASNDFKFGTRLHIPGIGECVVRDRMNTRYTGKGVVDVYMGYEHGKAWSWGRKTLDVTILE